jgi:hypothetical protein
MTYSTEHQSAGDTLQANPTSKLSGIANLAVAILLTFPLQAYAKHPRSSAVKAEFQRENPCPSTSKRRGACPGFVKDHRVALCVGGLDSVENMRWMDVNEAKAKDRWECRLGWQDRLKDCEERGCFSK